MNNFEMAVLRKSYLKAFRKKVQSAAAAANSIKIQKNSR